MKKLLLFFCTLVSMGAKAQIAFCPPGAEWHYSFFYWGEARTDNEKIAYTGKIIIGADTVKKLSHMRFFNSSNYVNPMTTYIKQHGDTIFMRNSFTSNNWQVLCNFAAQPGQFWTNCFFEGNDTINYSTVVDSIGQITINGINLKVFYVTMDNDISGFGANPYKSQIIERIGCPNFLFNYNHYPNSAHDGIVNEFLCYKDSLFATYQPGPHPCEYKDALGISEAYSSNAINVYPNPAGNILNIESAYNDAEIIISDLSGKILKQEMLNSDNSINISDLAWGMYFLQINRNGELVYKTKIVKE